MFVRNPALVDQTKTLLDKYRTAVAPIANRIVGSISADITRTDATPPGERARRRDRRRPAGVHDVLGRSTDRLHEPRRHPCRPRLRATRRAERRRARSTYGEAFTVQPFNNLVTTQTFTGAQIKTVLEQQRFPGASATPLVLQVSAGFTYTYSPSAAAGSRVSNMALNGTPIDPAATYRVTTNDFLANGGDSFPGFTVGTNRVYAPGFDVDALAAYLATRVRSGPARRTGSPGFPDPGPLADDRTVALRDGADRRVHPAALDDDVHHRPHPDVDARPATARSVVSAWARWANVRRSTLTSPR